MNDFLIVFLYFSAFQKNAKCKILKEWDFLVFNQKFKNQMKMLDEQSKTIINKTSSFKLQADNFKNSVSGGI